MRDEANDPLVPAIDFGTGRCELTPLSQTCVIEELPIGPSSEYLPSTDRVLRRSPPTELLSVSRDARGRPRQVARFRRADGTVGTCCILGSRDAADPHWSGLSENDRQRLHRAGVRAAALRLSKADRLGKGGDA